jgi:hypothetical protein
MKAEGPGSGLGPASFSPEGEEFFPSSHIADQILSDEAVRVYACASTDTRRIYDLAFDPDRPNDPNWIIRWFLWHVFRYRDGRQARQKHQRPKARPSRPFPYCGSKEDVRRNAMLYESASRDSCPRSWRPYTNDLFRTASTHQHYKVAAQKPYFDFGRSYYDDRHSHYTTSPPTPPMRTVDKHRFSGKSNHLIVFLYIKADFYRSVLWHQQDCAPFWTAV